ncbi:MAG: hypothetical protein RLZZ417_1016 [Bacteroidota bacterium]|jgi:phosphoglycolate phosphatase-like HAD superfamily hydrolase
MIKGCMFDLFEVIIKEFNSNEVKPFDPKSITPDDLTDGFLVFLKELKNKGIQIAVVSDYPFLKEVLDRLRITHLINIYLSKDQIDNSVMDLYHSAASLLNLKPKEFLLFKNEDKIEETINVGKFNVIKVGMNNSSNNGYKQIIDFSSVKFNQLVSSISNLN